MYSFLSNPFASLICVMIFSAVLCGCAVENEKWAKYPFFSSRSDKIAGLMSPSERREAIRAKGEKGKKATAEEREILLAQLLEEYKTNPDPNLRRDAVEAMGAIPGNSGNIDITKLRGLEEALADTEPLVRISALRGISSCGYRATDPLCRVAREDKDKDVRIEATKQLGNKGKYLEKSFPFSKYDREKISQHKKVLVTLRNALGDKTPAVRYAAMDSLAQATGKDYGTNIDSWMAYADYAIDGKGTAPAQRAFLEKIPTPQLPMLK